MLEARKGQELILPILKEEQREEKQNSHFFLCDMSSLYDFLPPSVFILHSIHSYILLCSLLPSFPCSGSRSSKTFKPKKNIPEGSHQYELLKHAEATLGSGNLRMAVMLPDGEDLNEWVAVNSKYPTASVSPIHTHTQHTTQHITLTH